MVTTRTVNGCQLVVAPTPMACAEVAAATIEAALAARPTPVLGVATGRTPRLTYETMVRRGLLGAGLRLVLLDEYLDLGPDDERSFSATIERQLAGPLDVPPDRVLVPPARPDPDLARCDAFEQRIRELGGVDVQILGIGSNGHIAFNEPGSPLDSRTRVVRLSPSTRRDNLATLGGSHPVPEWACTQGVGTILEARRLVLLATGAHKAAILAAALVGPVGPRVPASAIRLHPDAVVVADTEAARLTCVED